MLESIEAISSFSSNLIEIKRFANRYIEILLTSENKVRWVKIPPGNLEEYKIKTPCIKRQDIPRNKEGIYLLTCLVGNKKSYIGKANNLFDRIGDHENSKIQCQSLRKLNKNPQLITLAITKYGWHNFEIRILEIFDAGTMTTNQLLDLEEAYVFQYNLLDKNLGYNILPRGMDRTGCKDSVETLLKKSKARIGEKNPNFGKKHSSETKDKISKAHLGMKYSQETKDKLSKMRSGENHPMFGKTHSEETKRVISIAHLGRKQSVETREKISATQKKPVNQLNLETGLLIKRWDSAISVARSLSCSPQSISGACTGKQKTSHGFRWEYAII